MTLDETLTMDSVVFNKIKTATFTPYVFVPQKQSSFFCSSDKFWVSFFCNVESKNISFLPFHGRKTASTPQKGANEGVKFDENEDIKFDENEDINLNLII